MRIFVSYLLLPDMPRRIWWSVIHMRDSARYIWPLFGPARLLAVLVAAGHSARAPALATLLFR